MDNIENIIITVILAVIVAAIVFYLIRAKRKGQKCIGCPYAKQCGGNCNSQEMKSDNKFKNI